MPPPRRHSVTTEHHESREPLAPAYAGKRMSGFPFQSQLKGIVVESTFNWYWLIDGLMDAGYQCVHLANPSASKTTSYPDEVRPALGALIGN